MQIAKPAIMKPGVTLDTLPKPRPADLAGTDASRSIRGTALIMWDPNNPGKKRDAIDTD